MKYTDEQIRELLSRKIGEYESEVSPELWSNIASQLPQAVAGSTAAATTSGVAKLLSTKVIWAAAVTAITVASVITYQVTQKEEPQTTMSAPAKEQVDANKTEANNAATELHLQEAQANPAETESQEPRAPLRTQNNSAASTTDRTQQINTPIEAPKPHEPLIGSTNTTVQNSTAATPNTQNNQGNNSSQIATPSKNEQPAPQDLNAQFATVDVNKEELRYFFMPQYTDASQYLWDFGNGHTSTEMSPLYTFDNEGIFTIQLTTIDQKGNQKTTSQSLAVYAPGVIDVPNVFTPNGDGLNDYFDVREKSKNVEITKIIVLDKANKVFESEGDRLWDGTDFQGNSMPAGDYRYIVFGIDKEGHQIEKKGIITLRR